MALILENHKLNNDCYMMTIAGAPDSVAAGRPGQFLMLRMPGVNSPLLGRPISLFDFDQQTRRSTVCYKLVGKGTALMSALVDGQEIDVNGPFGNGFPEVEGDITLIGGGMGIAPLHLLAKNHRAKHPNSKIYAYLGYRDKVFLKHYFSDVADNTLVNVGGFITDDVDFKRDCTYFSCGPIPMMQAAAQRAHEARRTLYVAMEKHMACGVGACLSCVCQTKYGLKRVCKDGPVFLADEVFYE